MALSAVRNCVNFSKSMIGSKVLFTKSFSKSLFSVGIENSRTITRSLSYLTRSRDSNPICNNATKFTFYNQCNCGCYLHTKGDQELAAFLSDEIENEKKSQMSSSLPKLEGFECKLSGAEVELTRKLNGETIIISANVNNSVDAEETTMDPNEAKEPEEAEMKAKPDFTISIVKGKKTLSFECSYSHDMPEEEAEAYNDSFQITEVSMYENECDDSTYSVSGDIMDGYLYDLLMNYLEERGISNDFADKMIGLFTAYEHQLYIKLLQGMKSFVEK